MDHDMTDKPDDRLFFGSVTTTINRALATYPEGVRISKIPGLSDVTNVNHWESRALKAEAELAECQAEIASLRAIPDENAKLNEFIGDILWWGADDRPDGRWPCGMDRDEAFKRHVDGLEDENYTLKMEAIGHKIDRRVDGELARLREIIDKIPPLAEVTPEVPDHLDRIIRTDDGATVVSERQDWSTSLVSGSPVFSATHLRADEIQACQEYEALRTRARSLLAELGVKVRGSDPS